MELINRYFPQLTPQQREQFGQLGGLYQNWNNKINVISRKDIENLYERHVLHSLAIANFIHFLPHSNILDIGTGGGFPGIPLAILFPEVTFHLVDSIGKKITVVEGVAQALSLNNVTYQHARVEAIKGRKFDFAVTRAVAPLPELYQWTKHLIATQQRHPISNGLICLKGGDLATETQGFQRKVVEEPISLYFKGEFFETKRWFLWLSNLNTGIYCTFLQPILFYPFSEFAPNEWPRTSRISKPQ